MEFMGFVSPTAPNVHAKVRRTAHTIRRPVAITLLFVIPFLIATVACGPNRASTDENATSQLTSVPVVRQDIQEIIRSVGNVEFGAVSSLGFSQNGRLQDVAVRVGDVVRTGEILAQLDVRGLTRSIANTKSTLRQAELRLQQLTQPAEDIDIERAKLDVADAAGTVAELKALPDSVDLAGARASVGSSKHTLARSIEDLRAIEQPSTDLELAQAEHTLARVTEDLRELTQSSTAVEIAQAAAAVASARATLARAEATFEDLNAAPANASLVAAQNAVAAATDALANARENREAAELDHPVFLADGKANVSTREAEVLAKRKLLSDLRTKPTTDDVAKAKDTLERARLTHDDTIRTSSSASAAVKERAGVIYREAQRTYTEAVRPATPNELAEAEANLSGAESRLKVAQDRLTELQTGPDLAELDRAIEAARRRLANAQSDLQELISDPAERNVTSEQRNVESARLSLTSALLAQEDTLAGADANKVAVAKLQVRAAQLALDEAQADADANKVAVATRQVEAAQLSVIETETRLDHIKSGATPEEVQRAQRTLRRSELQLAQLQMTPDPIELELLQQAVADAQRGVAAAEDALADATLRALFDGIVVETRASPGEMTSGPVVVLADIRSLRVRSNIDETDIGSIAVGQQTTLVFEALPNTVYHGNVMVRSAQGEESQGLVSFPVLINIDNPDLHLLGGLTAEVEIVVSESQQALVVPRRSVRKDEDGKQSLVDVVDANGQVSAQEVTTGISDDKFIEILNGLTDRDSVAVRGTQLRDVDMSRGGGSLRRQT